VINCSNSFLAITFSIFSNLNDIVAVNNVISNINVKSLLVYSREDNDVKWLNAEYLERNLKDFELMETHGGHFMWIGEDMDVG